MSKSMGAMSHADCIAVASHSPARGRVLGEDAKVSLEMADLTGFALAFHEQHAVELERGGGIEIRRPFVGAEHVGVVGCRGRPPVSEREQSARVALQHDRLLAW